MSATDISPAPYQLDAFEMATGYVAGPDPGLVPLGPDAHQGMAPLEALESIVLTNLLHPPCLVVFSGGRDSSGVLAVATDVARRHGLPDPVPATNRFRAAPYTEEHEWQELVVRHLGLTDWYIREWEDELDVIGPVARPILARWGPVYPHNAHFAVPLLEPAKGGSALTGIGGDQIFYAGQGLRVARLLSGEQRPHLRDWRALAAAAAPRPLYRRVWERRVDGLPWLTPAADRSLRRRLATNAVAAPVWFAPYVRARLWRERARLATERTLGALSSGIGVLLAHPLQAPAFMASLAAALPRTGYRSRDEAMMALFGALLPPALLKRQTKASFNEAFFAKYSREFVRHWDGRGLDADLVDAARLKEVWAAPSVDARSFSALQGAWVAASDPERLNVAAMNR